MYLRFTKELFILHQLQHPRIVPVYACASTLDELTLVMKVIHLDSTKVHANIPRYCEYLYDTDLLRVHCVCITYSFDFAIEQYMQRGSLRSILNTSELWQQYTPVMRHQILCDVTEAMTYLHSQNVFHRDLKRYVL
jgi:serine/threonine protein kinase